MGVLSVHLAPVVELSEALEIVLASTHMTTKPMLIQDRAQHATKGVASNIAAFGLRYIAAFGLQVKNKTKCAQHLVHTQPLAQCARIPTPTNITPLERFGPLSRPTACVFTSRSRSSTDAGPHTTTEPADFTASPELVRLHRGTCSQRNHGDFMMGSSESRLARLPFFLQLGSCWTGPSVILTFFFQRERTMTKTYRDTSPQPLGALRAKGAIYQIALCLVRHE